MKLQERLLQLKQLILAIETRLDKLDKLDALERGFTSRGYRKSPCTQHQVSASEASAQSFAHLSLRLQHKSICGGQESASCTESRLAKELLERGITKFRFKRVPEHYYAEDLEYRRDCLQAASIQHLCKSLLYENPKLPADHECQDFRHCLVIVQVWFAVLIRDDASAHKVHFAHCQVCPREGPVICIILGLAPLQLLVLCESTDNLLGHCSMLQSCMVKS